MIARVSLEIALRREFDYAVPPDLADKVDVGSRVQVPFGARKILGVVTAVAEESAHANLKPIIKVIGAQTLVTAMSALGPAVAVLKRGARGSMAREGSAVIERPALTVPVVDTVGAGDAFVAGFLAARLRGRPTEECLELGAAAGAFACMGPGDWESLPRTEDLALLESNDPVSR